MYGTSSKAVYTLFEVTLSGCWPNYARLLIEDVSALYVIFFILYIMCVVFALIRIITALFLKDTMDQANGDMAVQVELKKNQKAAFEDKLLQLFEEADTSGDGSLSFEEFATIFENPSVVAWCSSIDIEINEIHALFELLDDGDGKISVYEFVHSMSRLKGNASSQDVVAILHDCHHIISVIESMQIQLGTLASGGRPEALEIGRPLHGLQELGMGSGARYREHDEC
jgi:Ca2+-binding EF-hand superfamily protein